MTFYRHDKVTSVETLFLWRNNATGSFPVSFHATSSLIHVNCASELAHVTFLCASTVCTRGLWSLPTQPTQSLFSVCTSESEKWPTHGWHGPHTANILSAVRGAHVLMNGGFSAPKQELPSLDMDWLSDWQMATVDRRQKRLLQWCSLLRSSVFEYTNEQLWEYVMS